VATLVVAYFKKGEGKPRPYNFIRDAIMQPQGLHTQRLHRLINADFINR